MTIRAATPDDSQALAAIANEVQLFSFANAALMRAMLERKAPPGTERFVAEVDGTVVGWSRCNLAGNGDASCKVEVQPAHRFRGVGAALYEPVEPRLRALGAPVLSTTIDDEDGRAFVVHRGFEPSNVMQLQILDLQEAQLDEPSADVQSLREVDPELLADLYVQCVADIPGRIARTATRQDFRRAVVENDAVDRGLSVVSLEDGEPVAFATVFSNAETGLAGTQTTCVRRDRRRRGLARTVKLASICRARDAGLRRMYTVNDLENEAMLTLNEQLGFVPAGLYEHFEKAL